MKPDFVLAYRNTLSFEGLYSCNPNDPGGETWKGISRRNWPLWHGWKIVDEIRRNTMPGVQFVHALKLDEELEDLTLKFYLREFWGVLNLDATGEHQIAEEIFDTSVNQGLRTGPKYFQHSLNLLNQNQKLYKDIETDGDIGSETLTALQSYMSVPGRSRERNVKTLLKVMNWLQMEKYVEICEQNPRQEVFLYGWLNRC